MAEGGEQPSGASSHGAGNAAAPSPEALMEALRPKSVQELHASIAGAARRRGPPPAVAGQLQDFCARRAACEERCVVRIRGRAAQEALLLPAAEGPEGQEERERRGEVQSAVARRFSTLESQCSAACGRRLAHLLAV
mmetsp:Transcript_47213/g.113244  ORF Transcript_47213/g.113244 Transcript_47213/m.113244 type:complete len:137 (+) Transcript_47213:54-464(+)